MEEAKDICHYCGKTEPTPSMSYVNEDSKYDDRLICSECLERKEEQ